jgi:hypothetical protein
VNRGEVTAVTLEDVDQRVTEVAQEMPAVCDLRRLGRSLAHALSVGAGAVAGDHLDARVSLEPRRHGPSLPVGQQRDGATALEVDDERAVGVAAPPSPVVDPDDPRLSDLRQRHGAHRAQQRVGADGNGETRREPGAGRAADGQAQAAMDLGQPSGPAQARGRDRGRTLGEDPAWAAGRVAPEATQAQMRLGGASLPGQVAQAAAVAAVDPARGALAPGTGGDPHPHPSLNDQPIGPNPGVLDDQVARQEGR